MTETALQTTQHQMTAPCFALVPSREEISVYEVIAKQAADSRFYQALGGLPGVLTIMLYARELGVSPMLAINQGFYNVHGRIEMSARLMNVLIRQRGHSVSIIHLDSQKCTLLGKRADDGSQYECTYTIEDARRAKLVKADGSWEKNPDDMLFARATSKLARRLFADVIGTAYVEGEVSQGLLDGTIEPVDVTPTAATTHRRGRPPKIQKVLAPEEPAPVFEQPAVDVEATPVQEPEVGQEVPPQEATAEPASEPSPEVVAMLTKFRDYLRSIYRVNDDGIEFVNVLICEQFGVMNADMVPAEQTHELRKFTKTAVLSALQEQGHIQPPGGKAAE